MSMPGAIKKSLPNLIAEYEMPIKEYLLYMESKEEEGSFMTR